jgi:hypothetical protein
MFISISSEDLMNSRVSHPTSTRQLDSVAAEMTIYVERAGEAGSKNFGHTNILLFALENS